MSIQYIVTKKVFDSALATWETKNDLTVSNNRWWASMMRCSEWNRLVGSQVFMSSRMDLDKLGIDQFDWSAVDTESGGGMTSTGGAKIICDLSGEKLKPFRRGSNSNDSHAFFAFKKGAGWLSISASYGHGDSCVIAITKRICLPDRPEIMDEMIGTYYDVDDPEIPEGLREAVLAVWTKANDYHCRSVYYAT